MPKRLDSLDGSSLLCTRCNGSDDDCASCDEHVIDFSLSYDGGTVALLTPLTDAGREWIAEHVIGETTYLGPSLAVEHRYLSPLLDGILSDGLAIAEAQ